MPAETLLLVNPRRRRKASKRRARKFSASSVAFPRARRHRRSRRSNPIRLPSIGGAQSLMRPALAGAVGALAVNGLVNYLPLPVNAKVGPLGAATRAIGAVLVGTVGRRIFGGWARDMAVGSLTVTATDLARAYAAQSGINLSGLAYYGPGFNPMKPRLPNGVSSTGALTMALSGRDSKVTPGKMGAILR